jgi:hypothetical protein
VSLYFIAVMSLLNIVFVVNFVATFVTVDITASIIESIWPQNISLYQQQQPEQHHSSSTKVVSLKKFIQEILRRSRTSYSTLQVSLFYIVRLRNKLIAKQQRQYQHLVKAQNPLLFHAAIAGGVSSVETFPPYLGSDFQSPPLSPVSDTFHQQQQQQHHYNNNNSNNNNTNNPIPFGNLLHVPTPLKQPFPQSLATPPPSATSPSTTGQYPQTLAYQQPQPHHVQPKVRATSFPVRVPSASHTLAQILQPQTQTQSQPQTQIHNQMQTQTQIQPLEERQSFDDSCKQSYNHHQLDQEYQHEPLPKVTQCGRRMLLASLIVATKYLQDRTYSNKAWSKISGLTLAEINETESAFLGLLDFELYVDVGAFGVWSGLVLERVRVMAASAAFLKAASMYRGHTASSDSASSCCASSASSGSGDINNSNAVHHQQEQHLHQIHQQHHYLKLHHHQEKQQLKQQRELEARLQCLVASRLDGRGSCLKRSLSVSALGLEEEQVHRGVEHFSNFTGVRKLEDGTVTLGGSGGGGSNTKRVRI